MDVGRFSPCGGTIIVILDVHCHNVGVDVIVVVRELHLTIDRTVTPVAIVMSYPASLPATYSPKR